MDDLYVRISESETLAPDFDKLDSQRQNQRTDDRTDQAEGGEPADQCDEHEKRVESQTLTHKFRIKKARERR